MTKLTHAERLSALKTSKLLFVFWVVAVAVIFLLPLGALFLAFGAVLGGSGGAGGSFMLVVFGLAVILWVSGVSTLRLQSWPMWLYGAIALGFYVGYFFNGGDFTFLIPVAIFFPIFALYAVILSHLRLYQSSIQKQQPLVLSQRMKLFRWITGAAVLCVVGSSVLLFSSKDIIHTSVPGPDGVDIRMAVRDNGVYFIHRDCCSDNPLFWVMNPIKTARLKNALRKLDLATLRKKECAKAGAVYSKEIAFEDHLFTADVFVLTKDPTSGKIIGDISDILFTCANEDPLVHDILYSLPRNAFKAEELKNFFP